MCYRDYKGTCFDRLRKLLRDKKVTTREYQRLTLNEYTFAGITQRCGWRKVLKASYRGYYAVRRIYLESYGLPNYRNPPNLLGGT